jgi:hypothetical protein
MAPDFAVLYTIFRQKTREKDAGFEDLRGASCNNADKTGIEPVKRAGQGRIDLAKRAIKMADFWLIAVWQVTIKEDVERMMVQLIWSPNRWVFRTGPRMCCL